LYVMYLFLQWMYPKIPRTVVLLSFFIAVLIFSTTIPKGSFVYKKNGTIEYITEDRFLVSPFMHDKPFVKGPNPKRGYFSGENLPKGWRVYIEYTVLEPSTLKVKDWLILKDAIENGIKIPKEIFDAPSKHYKLIEEYIKTDIPFIKTDVEVRFEN
jgi:hypothetical protein